MTLSKFLSIIQERPLKCDPEIYVENYEWKQEPLEKVLFVGDTKQTIILQINPEEEVNLRENLEIANKDLEEAQQENTLLKQEAEEKEDYFDIKDENERLTQLYDSIELSVECFAQIAGIRLVANDATNIDKLCEKYQELEEQLKEAQNKLKTYE